MDRHWGYQDGEEPAYGPCEFCWQMVRLDREDLMMEHDCICEGETRIQRLDAKHELEAALFMKGKAA